MTSIYLDNNATTRIAPEVAHAIADVWSSGFVNSASQHHLGQVARRRLDQCRQTILEAVGGRTVGMDCDRLLFTSGGTESNNLAVLGLADPKRQVVVSAVEHPSVLEAAEKLKLLNFDVQVLKVDCEGRVLLDHLEQLLRRKPTALVSVMAANNETGTIQPVREVCQLAHEFGAVMHCDAVQWAGKLPLESSTWGVDALSISCHKFHGPVGIGALVLKRSCQLQPLFHGGFQQDGLRPGTENLALAVGFEAAVKLFQSDLDRRCLHMTNLRDRLEQQLLSMLPVSINSAAVARLPHTSNIALLGVDRQAFLLAADFNELCLSTGSACASGSSDPSPVLMAMGCSKSVVDSSIRVSLAADSTESQVDQAVERIVRIYRNLIG